MENSDVKIIGAWASPYALRPMSSLNVKSVGYEIHEEAFGAKSELLLKSNPVFKKIPVLIHGDKIICESVIIMEYIDEVWSSSGRSILPSDPYDRAIARFWAAYLDEKWFPSVRAIAKAPTQEAKKAAFEQVVEGLGLMEGAFESCSKGKPFFGGDQIGFLDIALGCFLGWVRVTERIGGTKLIDESTTPGLAKWAERFCANADVKDVMPDTDKLVEYAKDIIAKFKASSNQ